jgi:hypothetical protein
LSKRKLCLKTKLNTFFKNFTTVLLAKQIFTFFSVFFFLLKEKEKKKEEKKS